MILLESWGLYHPLQPTGTLGAREHNLPPPHSLWDPPQQKSASSPLPMSMMTELFPALSSPTTSRVTFLGGNNKG